MLLALESIGQVRTATRTVDYPIVLTQPLKVKVSSEDGEIVLQFSNPPGAVVYIRLSPQVIMARVVLPNTLLSIFVVVLATNPCNNLEPFP